MRGWVYVISNESMPGMVKIGYSMKDPAFRAEELAHTGTPLPYLVDYEVLVHEPQSIEQGAHEVLKELRVSDKREWFRCPTHTAVTAIRSVVGSGGLLENFIRANDVASGGPISNVPQSPWTLSRSTGILKHVPTGIQFQYGQYYADNSGTNRGLVIRDKELHWASRDRIIEIP